MIWRKLVTRKVTPLAAALFDESYLKTIERCRIEGIKMPPGLSIDNILFIDATHHIDSEKLMPFFQSLIRQFDESDHDIFLKMTDTIEKDGQEFLDYLDNLEDLTIEKLDRQTLQVQFTNFMQQYVKFASLAIAPPFAIEFMYNTRFQSMVVDFTKRVIDEQNIPGRDFLHRHISRPEENLYSQALSLITKALDISIGYTFAEQRNIALYKIAAEIERDSIAFRFFNSSNSISSKTVEQDYPLIHQLIINSLNAFGWLKQWSFPPYYQPYTYEDFLKEIQTRLNEHPGEKINELEYTKDKGYALYKETISVLELSDLERKFLETVVRFNFIRTWRMEINIRAMYCMQRLCSYLGQYACANGLLSSADDIYFLTHWEIQHLLDSLIIPTGISERKEDYAIIVNRGQVEILTGNRLINYKEKFYSVIDFRENGRGIHGHEAKFVGGKAENLFSLIDFRFSVPKFFVLTSNAYQLFLKENSLEPQIARIIKEGRSIERKILNLYMAANVPTVVKEAILEQIQICGLDEVIIRSSASIEDAPEFSWAGRFDSIPYVDKSNLMDNIKLIWASLFTERACAYALKANTNLQEQIMGVIIQEMIDPEFSGVANTTLSAAAKDVMEIEVAYGQGTSIVSGEITPDRYLVQKSPAPVIVEKYISEQKQERTRSGWKKVELSLAEVQKLSDDEIIKLAVVLANIEKLYERPQDVEFCYKAGQLYILQARPQTGLGIQSESGRIISAKGILLLSGMKGKVESILEQTARVLLDPKEGSKFKTGLILVTEAATPVWDPITFRAAGLITNEGGSTCHAIRVSNELGIPAVVGTGKATKEINDGDMITIDTTDPLKGKVYR